MKGIKSYFYFTGENIDGDILDVSLAYPMTTQQAKIEAEKELKENGGGHIDVWYSETDEFAFDVEV